MNQLDTSHLYAVILAGGSGTRLWPRSRRAQPKQLLDLLSARTMLQETFERIAPLVPTHNTFVITNRDYVQDVREQIPSLPEAQVIGEPEGRGTAPPVGLASLLLRERDPDAVMLVLPADHAILRGDNFREALTLAAQVANRRYLVTLGIIPEYPETGYGYIQAGEELREFNGDLVFRVRRFTEKPDTATAHKFVASGNYYWNSGIFIWRADVIFEEFGAYLPNMLASLQEIAATGLEPGTYERTWHALDNETIDFGIMEKSNRVAVIPLDAGWSDVGSWASLFDLMPHDGAGNVVVGEHVGIGTHSSLIYSKNRLIATVGLQDMIIVDAGDAVLVCPRDRAQQVKQIVDELKRRGAQQYL